MKFYKRAVGHGVGLNVKSFVGGQIWCNGDAIGLKSSNGSKVKKRRTHHPIKKMKIIGGFVPKAKSSSKHGGVKFDFKPTKLNGIKNADVFPKGGFDRLNSVEPFYILVCRFWWKTSKQSITWVEVKNGNDIF